MKNINKLYKLIVFKVFGSDNYTKVIFQTLKVLVCFLSKILCDFRFIIILKFNNNFKIYENFKEKKKKTKISM